MGTLLLEILSSDLRSAIIGAIVAAFFTILPVILQLKARKKEIHDERKAHEQQAAQDWFIHYYVVEGFERVISYTGSLITFMTFFRPLAGPTTIPPLPTEAILKLHELLGCQNLLTGLMYLTFQLYDTKLLYPELEKGQRELVTKHAGGISEGEDALVRAHEVIRNLEEQLQHSTGETSPDPRLQSELAKMRDAAAGIQNALEQQKLTQKKWANYDQAKSRFQNNLLKEASG